MDVVQNLKSMSAGQFLGLQVFELVYLAALAFLPFVVAIRETAWVILGVSAVVILIALFGKLTYRCVDAKSKVVLITGCDSGFGHACARHLVSHGFTVVASCHDTTSDGARSLREAAGGEKLTVVSLDVTRDDEVQKVLLKVKGLNSGKGLWALVNNVGVASCGSIEFLPLEEYRRIMDINLFGTIRMTKACLPLIRAAKGRVILMSGSAGRLSLPGQSAFSTSIFGLEAFADALRLEMRPFGVKVVTIRLRNFLGGTCLLNKSGLEQLRSHFATIEQSCPSEIRIAYGQDHLKKQLDTFERLSKSTADSLMAVIEAMENAVLRQSPKAQILVDGGNQIIDLQNMLISLRQFVPVFLHDWMVSRLYGTHVST